MRELRCPARGVRRWPEVFFSRFLVIDAGNFWALRHPMEAKDSILSRDVHMTDVLIIDDYFTGQQSLMCLGARARVVRQEQRKGDIWQKANRRFAEELYKEKEDNEKLRTLRF